MADVERIVSIVFNGVDKVSQVAKSASRSLDDFSGSVADITEPFDTLANKVLMMEAAVNVLAAGIAALAIKMAGEFQDSFGEISTLIDDTDESINSFSVDILNYAKTSTASLGDINQAVYNAISAGVDYRQSLAFLNETEKLSAAGLADLNSTTKLLASTLNAYNEETDQAGKYSDIFFMTVKKGQTTIPELSQSLAQVTSIAAGAKIPIETLMAAIAALTAAGMDTPQAITALKGAISAIISPTKEASEMAEDLHIEFNAEALASKGLEGVLRDVMAATKGNVEQINTLFGNVRGLSGVLSLATNDSSRFKDALEAMQNSAGATNTAFEKVSKNFSNINQNMANNFEITMVLIGKNILDSYGGIVGSIVDIFQGIQIGIDEGAFDPIFNVIDEFGKDAAAYLKTIAANLPEALKIVDYSGLIASYENLGSAVKGAIEAVFGEIDLSTPEGLAAAIQKVVDGITLLTNVTKGIVDGMTPFLKALGLAIDEATELDSDTAELIGQFLGFAKGVHTVFSNIELLTGALATLAGASIMNTITSLGRLVTSTQGVTSALSLFSGGLGLLAGTGGILAAGVGAFWLLDKAITANAAEINNLIDYVGDLAKNYLNLSDTNKDAASTFGMTMDEIKSVVEEIQTLRGEVAGYIQTIDGLGPEGAKAFMDSAEQVRREIVKLALEMDLPVMRVDVDTEEVSAAGQVVKKELPDQKTIKTDVEIEKEKVKEQRELLEKAMEIKAQINMAEIEAATKRFQTMFESINAGMENTGQNLIDLWGIFSGEGLDIGERMALERQIDQENERRQQQFDLQKKLIDQQIKSIELKNERLRSGKPLIEIDAPGLKPHLEAIFWTVIEEVQIQVNEEEGNFLLGI